MPGVTGIWKRLTRGAPAGRLALAGFGKHPAWAEHIQDLGMITPALAEWRRVLYVEGILRLTEEWEQLEPGCRSPFDHWLLLIQPGGVILSRVVASADRMGRTSFPFVLAAELTDCTLACVVRKLPSLMQEFMRRVRQFPTPEAVRAAFTSEQGAWQSLLSGEPAASEPELTPTAAERTAFVEQRGLGPDGQGLARLLHKTESAWSSLEGGRGGKAPKLDRDATPVRVPCARGQWEASVLLWEEFVSARVHAEVPRLYIVPVNSKWLDLVLGRLEGRCFYGLRANQKAFVPETAVTHEFDPALLQEAVRTLELWRAGAPGQVASRPAAVTRPPTVLAPLEAERVRAEPAEPVQTALARAEPANVEPPAAELPPAPAAEPLRPSAAVTPLEPVPAVGRAAIALETSGATLPATFERPDVQVPERTTLPSPPRREPSRPTAPTPVVSETLGRGGKPRATHRGVLAVTAMAVLGLATVGWWLFPKGTKAPPASAPTVAAPTASPPARPETTSAELRERVSGLIAQGRYREALESCRAWAAIEPDNAEPKTTLANLTAPPTVIGDPRIPVRAGEETRLPVLATDQLQRQLASEVVVAPAAGDRLDRRGDHWVYAAAPGGARTNSFSLAYRHELAGATVNVQVVVAPDAASDLLARGDAAFQAHDFATALALYQQLSMLRPPEPAVAQRIRELLTPPTVVLPTGLVVRAGSQVTIPLETRDVLGRRVTVEAAPSVVPAVGALRRLDDAGVGSWAFTAAPGTSDPVGLEFRASNGQTSIVARLTIPVLPSQAEETFRLGEAALAGARFSEALKHFREVLAEDANHSVARARLDVLTNPPPLRLRPAGGVECLFGQTVTGRVELAEAARLQPPIPWQIEAGDRPADGDFAFDPRASEWRWTSPTGLPATVALQFRAIGPTATSVWQTVRVSARAPRLPIVTGLPAGTLELVAGQVTQTSLVFQVSLPGGATDAVVSLAQEGGGSPLTLTLSPPVDGVRKLVLAGLDRPSTNKVRVEARTTEGAVTNSFSVVVRAGAGVEAPTKPQLEPRRDDFIPPQFVWVPFSGGGTWKDSAGPGLWVSRRETSRGDYRLLMMTSPPSAAPGTGSGDELPVTNVSLKQALDYCKRLNEAQARVLPAGWEFRLPTLEEWRAFGNDGHVLSDAVLDRSGAEPVESGQPNRWGIYHAVGNVAEFRMPRPSDARPATLGSSFAEPLAKRVSGEMAFRKPDADVGFRVVLAPALAQSLRGR